jgi:hypothetical protein
MELPKQKIPVESSRVEEGDRLAHSEIGYAAGSQVKWGPRYANCHHLPSPNIWDGECDRVCLCGRLEGCREAR